MENKNVLGKRLQAVCQQKNMSFRELAEKSGVPEKTILRIAWGSRTNPGIFLMINICDALDITVDEFFGTEEFDEFRKKKTE